MSHGVPLTGRQPVTVAPDKPFFWQSLVDVAFVRGTPIERCEEVGFAPEPSNVARARRFALDQVPDADAERRAWLAVLTSELATNVVVHARTQMRVVVMLAGEDVVVGVHDLDLGRREVVTHDRDGGRGLHLVDAVAEAHGQVRHPEGGKTMWFRLSLEETA